MPRPKANIFGAASLLCFCALAQVAAADTFSTIYSFKGGADGEIPATGPIVSRELVLFGTTAYGGKSCPPAPEPTMGCGTVWRLNPGGLKQTLFQFNGTFNGDAPLALLVRRGDRLYGITAEGGSRTNGHGVIYSVGVDGKDFKLLHRFTGYDGSFPNNNTTLRFDSIGDLFGNTSSGGKFGYGVLYELRPDGTYTVLHHFSGGPADGATPEGLFMDATGTLYGSTQAPTSGRCDTRGNPDPGGCGIVYSYDPASGTFKTIYAIRGKWEGRHLLIGGENQKGDLFGAAYEDGKYGDGTLFVLRKTGQSYAYRVLHDFTGKADGLAPFVPQVDAHGGMVGLTLAGGLVGTNRGAGTLYSYKAGVFTTLHTFTGGTGGGLPNGTPFVQGNTIYGTVTQGGLPNCPYNGVFFCGAVWKYTRSP